MAKVVGRPAKHASFLSAKFAAQSAAAVFVGIALLGALAFATFLPWQARVIGFIAAAAVCAWVARDRAGRASRAAVGVRSERKVSDAFRSSGLPGTLVNGALIGAGGDLDHAFVWPWGVVLIETKTGFGSIRRDGRGIVVGKRTIPGDPIEQVCRQARAVEKAFPGVPLARVVVIPDGRGHFDAGYNGYRVGVGGLDELMAWLPQYLQTQPVLDDRAQAAIVKWLRQGR